MKKIEMISKASHLYAGKRVAVGDRFEVRGRSDAQLMRALGRADFAPVAPVVAETPTEKPKRTYVRRVLEAAPEVPPAPDVAQVIAPDLPADTEAKPKRTYTRRDMTAEE